MRARTRHQIREWKWVLWFLTVGWLWLILLCLWELGKIVVLGSIWLFSTTKVVLEDYAGRVGPQ